MFKPGDRVRLTEDYHYFRNGIIVKGDTGIIVDVFHTVDGIDVAFIVQFDSKPDNGIVVNTVLLELIPETTVKGKTMNDREAYQALLDGDILVAKNGDEYYLEKDSGILCLYHDYASLVSRNVSLPLTDELSIKQKTININGFEVPEPIRDASKFQYRGIYYIPGFTNGGEYNIQCNWTNTERDFELLNAGLVHLTRENAVKHAAALLSFTTTQSLNNRE